MWQPGKKIPTNLITGFLGSGKTTAIRDLLSKRPAGERWSIFINEYGMVSIDPGMVAQGTEDVQVEELGGGCFCCTTSIEMQPMLAQFIRRSKPDRLLIEPSGAGHPARVIDILRGPGFAKVIDLRATICLIDPADYDNPRVTKQGVFQDQIQMADIVAINFLDERDAVQVARCRNWLETIDPPKLLIAETQLGKLDPAWLDLEATVARPPKFDDEHAEEHRKVSKQHDQLVYGIQVDLAPPRNLTKPTRGKPIRLENEGLGKSACGWIFSNEEIFDRDSLFDFLSSLKPILRVKGIFRCDEDWLMFNRVGSTFSFGPSAYRRDSRLEIIVEGHSLDWNTVESGLLQTLASKAPS